MEENATKLIVILGMHRSGTSVITRGLKVLGVELGNNLMAPSADNPKGFWEDLDVNSFNIALLKFLDYDWDSLTIIEDEDVDKLQKYGYLGQAIELINKKTKGVSVFGLKDPRIAKLLPFWKTVFDHCQLKVYYLLSIRNPLSVSQSLAKRDGFDREKSYLLWLEHVINSLIYTQNESSLVVDYDNFMQNPDRELSRIAKWANLNMDTREFEKFKSDFLDSELRHWDYQLKDLLLDEAAIPLIEEIYSVLRNLAADKSRIDKEQVWRWNREFSRMKSVLAYINRLDTKIASVSAERERELQETKTELQKANQSLLFSKELVREIIHLLNILLTQLHAHNQYLLEYKIVKELLNSAQKISNLNYRLPLFYLCVNLLQRLGEKESKDKLIKDVKQIGLVNTNNKIGASIRKYLNEVDLKEQAYISAQNNFDQIIQATDALDILDEIEHRKEILTSELIDVIYQQAIRANANGGEELSQELLRFADILTQMTDKFKHSEQTYHLTHPTENDYFSLLLEALFINSEIQG